MSLSAETAHHRHAKRRTVDNMGLDTVRLRSPAITHRVFDHVEQMGERVQRVKVCDPDDLLWSVTRTDLRGSFDSRIMVKPLKTEFVNDAKGRLTEQPCAPYLMVECSIPKAFTGQNVYGCFEDFQGACRQLINLLTRLLGVALPDSDLWRVERVDWAENFALSYDAIGEFFQGIHSVSFPRRKVHKHGRESIFIPGSTTTVKLYHKGPEFGVHDHFRLKRAYRNLFTEMRAHKDDPSWPARRAERVVQALQRLANSRLRVEVEVKGDKLSDHFGVKPMVRDVPLSFFHEVWDKELRKLMREGERDTRTVRESLAVKTRLHAHYAGPLAVRLYAFWVDMAKNGEDEARSTLSRPTFYRYRKQLQDAGVSWLTSDVSNVERDGRHLPLDFSPVRSDPRRCVGHVRDRAVSLWNYGLTQLAA